MSGVPGFRSPIARGLLGLAFYFENVGRWWNREPKIPLANGGIVRLPPRKVGEVYVDLVPSAPTREAVQSIRDRIDRELRRRERD